VVGKAPTPGATKTRLSPPLSLAQAADLYGGFLQDTVRMGLELGWERVTLVYPPGPGAEATLVGLLSPDGNGLPGCLRLRAQPGRGLGAALAGAFGCHLADGFERVVLIGSDNPTLPPELVEAAARGLDDHDLVIGPSADGGYYLIGMDRPHLGVFERITWSTEVVYRETLERAREQGLRVCAAPEWYDVDTVAELERLRAELGRLPETAAPATRAVLATLRW
jgi:rSAM/selenodomain-associated transferase 1